MPNNLPNWPWHYFFWLKAFKLIRRFGRLGGFYGSRQSFDRTKPEYSRRDWVSGNARGAYFVDFFYTEKWEYFDCCLLEKSVIKKAPNSFNLNIINNK